MRGSWGETPLNYSAVHTLSVSPEHHAHWGIQKGGVGRRGWGEQGVNRMETETTTNRLKYPFHGNYA